MGTRSELEKMFKGRHFEPEVIIVSVRWYLKYKLSTADISEMMAERGISVDPSTIWRWVKRYAPDFEKKWQRFASLIGPSWRVDETYIKVKGKQTYLYRGVDTRTKRRVALESPPQRQGHETFSPPRERGAWAKAQDRHAGRISSFPSGGSRIFSRITTTKTH